MKNKDLYVSYSNTTKSKVSALKECGVGKAVFKSKGSTTFQEVLPNISVREEFNFTDYERFRTGETVPRDQRQIIDVCNKAYYRVGLIRNVIDLMADFGSKGATPVHKNKLSDNLYNNWWSKIHGQEISERFLNLLYRTGNVICKRITAKLRKKDIQNLQKTVAAPDILQLPPANDLDFNEVPWQYTFLNPSSLEILDEEDIAIFKGDIQLGLNINSSLLKSLRENHVIDTSNVVKKKRRQLIPLDMTKIITYYYKKDDWQAWAYPMIYSILDNLMMIEKLRLADFAALDGAISHIRLWKLGNLEHKIFPRDAAMDRLSDILINNVGGGSVDIIWGPDIELTETGTEIHKFLGMEKYLPHINAVYEGLGIPPTLTGSQVSSGFTNNFISLKTLTERLSYGRSLLSAFWQNEFKLFQKSLNLRQPAILVYDRMNLSDEAAEKALFVQLADRSIVSNEAVQRIVGEIPEVEQMRMKREDRMRNSGKLPPKAGPWHNPEHEESLEKIALQRGLLTPFDLGLTENDNLTNLDNLDDLVDQPQPGRPKNSKDKQKRKRKRVLPRTSATSKFAAIYISVKDIQGKVADIIHPIYLGMTGKKNLRQLTDKEFENLESMKFALLCNLPTEAEISLDLVKATISSPLLIPEGVLSIYKRMSCGIKGPTVDKLRSLQALVYSIYVFKSLTGLGV